MKVIFDVKKNHMDDLLDDLKKHQYVRIIRTDDLNGKLTSSPDGERKEVEIDVSRYEKSDVIGVFINNLNDANIIDYNQSNEEFLWGFEQSLLESELASQGKLKLESAEGFLNGVSDSSNVFIPKRF